MPESKLPIQSLQRSEVVKAEEIGYVRRVSLQCRDTLAQAVQTTLVGRCEGSQAWSWLVG